MMTEKQKSVLDTLERLGCIICADSAAVTDAPELAKALRKGGMPALEIRWDPESGAAVLAALRAEKILVGAAVKTAQEAGVAFLAGAEWVVCEEAADGCILRGGQNDDFAVRLAATDAEALGKASEGTRDGQYVQFEVTEALAACAAAAIGSVSCGCCFFPLIDAELARQDWEGIAAKCKTVVKAMLQMKLHHIGIDCADAEDGAATANRTADLLGLTVSKETPTAYFVDSFLEIMKGKGAGQKGHISISVPCIGRAIAYLEAVGTKMRPGSGQYNAKGELFVIYLEEEIGGFAVHLIQSQ